MVTIGGTLARHTLDTTPNLTLTKTFKGSIHVIQGSICHHAPWGLVRNPSYGRSNMETVQVSGFSIRSFRT